MLLLVLGHKGLLQSIGTRFLQQKLQLRAPYVTPLNILQVCIPSLNLHTSHVLYVQHCSTTNYGTAGLLLKVNQSH